MNETSRERETLFPTTRKLARELRFAFRQPEFLDAYAHRLSPIFHRIHARDKIEIFLNAQILPKTESLRHVTDFAFDRFTLGDHIVTQNSTASVVGAEQSAKHSQKRSLATAVWPKEPVNFARAHRKIDMIDRGDLAKTLCHFMHLDDMFTVFHFDLNSTSTGWPGCRFAATCGSNTDSTMNTSFDRLSRL